MKRPLNLRQIEAFKAVIEYGSVSRAAQALFVSQPAVSKLLTHLEQETGLALFERVRGKLSPTGYGKRLYEQVDRVFSGLQQIEEAVESIRRDEQRHLRIGVLPALSGSFVRRVSMRFLEAHADVRLSIETRGSLFVADWLVARKIDVGLVVSGVDNPFLEHEVLIRSPLVCAMHPNHALANKRVIRPRDLHGVPFVSFEPNSQTHTLVRSVFDEPDAQLNVVLDTSTAPTLCEFVAEGLGVSLVHPLFAYGMQKRLVLRRFEPELSFDFYICRNQAARNASLVDAFIAQAREVAAEVSSGLLKGA
jgi:DNA-binding transcriptional LysR family regulator